MKIKALAPDDLRATLPLYTIREAAGFLDLPVSTLHNWIKPPEGKPLVSTLPVKGHAPRVSFVGFAEAFVVAAARKRGLSTRELHEGVEGIAADWGIQHALANRLIYMDNKLYLGVRDPQGDHHERARDRQLQMIEAVKSEIQFIEFGGDDYADRITLPAFNTDVVVSPFVAGGQPIVRRSGIRVADVARRYAVKKESVGYIAEDFGLTEDEVLDLAHATPAGTAPR